MTTKLYLDARSSDGKSEVPIKIAINVFSSSAYIKTGLSVLPSQWDRKAGKVIGHPLKARYNLILSEKKLEADRSLDSLRVEGQLHGLSASQIRARVIERLDPSKAVDEAGKRLFMRRFDIWTESRKAKGTKVSYRVTAKKIRAYDKRADKLLFEDITHDWLVGFDDFMSKTAPMVNSRNISLRNIRAVFNDAIDEEITEWYPFRKFKISPEPTRDRSLPGETLKRLLSIPCEPWQAEARDMFFLVFYLCGINIGDLASVTEAPGGRIETLRMKTGQPLCITVIPEAQRIIDKYKGKEHLVNILDRYSDYRSYAHRVNDALKKIGKRYDPATKKWSGTAVCPDASIYWARYSWATAAAELDIPEKTIAAALGHSTKQTVTSIYTRNDMRKKIEESQKKVAALLSDFSG